MVIVYYKGKLEDTFNSLKDAEQFVDSCKESGLYSTDSEDYSYSFY